MANAGRVAIVPKGDYSSSTAYKRLDLVRYNDKAYVAKKANTGIVPTNTEYWMLMTSDGIVIDSALSDSSTNAVQNKVLKSALDSIQTTSRATLSQAGWYRVASYRKVTNGNPRATDNANGCYLTIKVGSYERNPEEIKLQVMVSNKTVVIVPISVLGTYHHSFTKARYTYDTDYEYLEVYYAFADTKQLTQVVIDGSMDYYKGMWQAITPTLTSETVSGVTVTTTYDIPANAKPVTDLDIADLGKLFKTSAWDSSWTTIAEAKLGVYALLSENLSITDLPSDALVSSTVAHYLIALSFSNINQKTYILTEPPSKKMWVGTVYGGSIIWSAPLATTSDLTTALAGYVPKTGGAVEGSLTVGTINDTDNRTLYLFNNARRIMLRVNSNGSFDFYDITHDKSIINSIPEGTNTFNGTATGNLALDALSFSTTAPSNTSALWVDTANKVIKAYIDGAWTQVS